MISRQSKKINRMLSKIIAGFQYGLSTTALAISKTTQNCLTEMERAHLIREQLIEITGNSAQVAVILLVAKGYAYKEITNCTGFKNESTIKNTNTAGRRKIITYLLHNPAERKILLSLLSTKSA